VSGRQRRDAVDQFDRLSNAGTINVNAATSPRGSFTFAQLGSITNTGGTVKVTGTIGTIPGDTECRPRCGIGDGGARLGGRSRTERSTMPDPDGVLQRHLGRVTYQGTLDLSAPCPPSLSRDGITLTGASGSGPGAINLTSSGPTASILYAQGRETLDNATISIGNASSSNLNVLYNYDASAPRVSDLGST